MGSRGSCDCVGFGDFRCTGGFGVGLGILMVLWWAAVWGVILLCLYHFKYFGRFLSTMMAFIDGS